MGGGNVYNLLSKNVLIFDKYQEFWESPPLERGGECILSDAESGGAGGIICPPVLSEAGGMVKLSPRPTGGESIYGADGQRRYW